jgi:hypothetical protein
VKQEHIIKAINIRHLILVLTLAAMGCGSSAPKSESITGCLNLRSGGQYILTEEKTARVLLVIAADADLKPHGHNHRVTVTGTFTNNQGRDAFNASTIQHLNHICS